MIEDEGPERAVGRHPLRGGEGWLGVPAVVDALDQEIALLIEVLLQRLRRGVERDGEAVVVVAAPENERRHVVRRGRPRPAT